METLRGLIWILGKFALPIGLFLVGLIGAVLIGHALAAPPIVYGGLYVVLTFLLTLAVILVGMAVESRSD